MLLTALSIQLTGDVLHQLSVTNLRTDSWNNVLLLLTVSSKTTLETSNVFPTQFVKRIHIGTLKSVRFKTHVVNSLICVGLCVISTSQLLLVFLSFALELDLLTTLFVRRLRIVNTSLLVNTKSG